MSQEQIVPTPAGIQWGAPPPDGRDKSKHYQIVEALKSRPGEWALILRSVNPGVTGQIKRGGLAAYRDGEYETRTVGVENRKVDVYARYMGPKL